MLASILAKRQAGDLIGAEAELEERALQCIGMPLAVLKHSPPDAVVELLATAGARRHERGVLLAELLLQDGELAEARGNPFEALGSYQLASRLLTDALGVLTVDEERRYREKLERLAVKLRDLGDGSA